MSEKATILVTGSSGMIGYPVAQRLTAWYNVVCFDRRAPSHPPPSAECLYVDLTSETSTQRGLNAIRELHGNRLASVIHLAAYYDFSKPTSPLYDEVTVQGTTRLLRLLQDFEVEQFIFSSTELVHAPSKPGLRLDEDSPLDPQWGYPKSKVETEKVIRTQRGKIPALILRIAGVYDELCDSIPLAHQIQRVYERDITAYFFPGDKSQGRQAFVHNEDVIDAILRAVERRHDLPPEVTLLIGEPKSPSFDELQRAFARLIHGASGRTLRVPRWFAKFGAVAQERLFGREMFVKPWMVDLAADNFELDISRARAVLGWEPKHRVLDTLPQMVAALKADPLAFHRENDLTPPLWLQDPSTSSGQALAPAPLVPIPADADEHQLFQLAEQVVRETTETSATLAPMAMRAGHAGHESMKMSGQDASAHEGMQMSGEHASGHKGMQMSGEHAGGDMSMMMPGMTMEAPERADGLRAAKARLDKMRAGQSLLAAVREREVSAQKEHDKQARALMERDPKAHVQFMQMAQEHRLKFLELPRTLLRREAETYQEFERAAQAEKEQAKAEVEPGAMMAGMMAEMHWTHIPLLVLGLWLVVSPFTLGYSSAALTWSDVISGLLVIGLGLAAMFAHRPWPLWAVTLIGLWLAFAPLAFSAPDAAAYANDTLVGSLLVVFAIILAMIMPMSGPTVPFEWSYSPSTWLQRAPILTLAFFSFFMSRYMAAYQLGHISWAWDPIFGDGTVRVLSSTVSKMFPVSDAGLGAYTYLVELLSGFMGDASRWRTMPWMVAIFGVVVVPLGVVSVFLIILQPVVVGAWCTFCLLSALFMLIMVALSLDEVIAMLLFMWQSHKTGKSLWRTFWLGGNALEYDLTPTRDHASKTEREPNGLRAMFWGVTLPWNLLATAALGLWLMASPAIFGTRDLAAHSDHILGALVVTASLIALAEVGRAVRFANIALALGIIVLPWLLGGGSLLASINALVVGVLIIALSFSPGKIKNTYGSWNPLII